MLARPDVLVLVAERDGVPAGYVSAVRRLHLWLGTGHPRRSTTSSSGTGTATPASAGCS